MPNSSPYTIEYKIVRNSHVLSQKLAFSQVPQQLSNIQSTNCSHTNYQKQQFTAHKSIVKRYMAKCYKHAPLSSKRTIVVTGVSKPTNISTQNTKQINLTSIVKYNINISKWLVPLTQKAACPLIYSICHRCQIRENIQQ